MRGLSSSFFLAIVSIALFACGTSRTVNRLGGTWGLIRANGGERFETWSKASSDAWTGRGFRVSGADTVLLETLTLRKSNGRWQYIAEVPDQNDGKPITFDCTVCSRYGMIFTNAFHDFPQRIGYRLVPDSGDHVADSLIVTLGTLEADQVVLRFTRRL